MGACGRRQPVVTIWGDEGVTQTTELAGYDGLLLAIAEFFHTGRAPVNPAETVEVIEFMTAAQLSKERGGAQVRLEELRKTVTAKEIAHAREALKPKPKKKKAPKQEPVAAAAAT